MKRLLLLLFNGLLLLSCNNVTKNTNGLTKEFSDSCYVETISTFDKLNENLLKPSSLKSTDSCIYIYEPSQDSLILVYNKYNSKFYRFLSKGNGPCEALMPSLFSTQNLLYVFDIQQKRLFTFDERERQLSVVPNDYMIDNSVSTSFAVDDSLLFMTLVGTDNQVLLKQGSCPARQICAIKNFGSFTGEDVSWILQGKITVDSKKKKLFWISNLGDAYKLYDYSNLNDIICNKYSILSFPNVNPNTKQYQQDANIGALEVVSSSDNVFVLYCGKCINGVLSKIYNAEALKCSNNILVYDWNGNAIKKIVTNHELCSISYDNHDDKLYGIEINDEGEYTVCEIPLI